MKSIRAKLWTGMMILVGVIIVLLWLFQIVFLDKFYTVIEIGEVRKNAKNIVAEIEELTEIAQINMEKSFLQNKLVVPLQPMKTARFSECIFFIRIMSADAVIFVMQAMRFPHRQGEKVSAESLCRIALSVLKNTASKFCSLTLL